jgi:hypothetical protein
VHSTVLFSSVGILIDYIFFCTFSVVFKLIITQANKVFIVIQYIKKERKCDVFTSLKYLKNGLKGDEFVVLVTVRDGLTINMSGQHVCVLQVRVPLLPQCVFWRLIWRTESLDRGLILVCRFSFVSSRECIPVAAQTRSCLQGWMHVRNPLLLPNGQAIVTTCAGGMIIVSECLS